MTNRIFEDLKPVLVKGHTHKSIKMLARQADISLKEYVDKVLAKHIAKEIKKDEVEALRLNSYLGVK